MTSHRSPPLALAVLLMLPGLAQAAPDAAVPDATAPDAATVDAAAPDAAIVAPDPAEARIRAAFQAVGGFDQVTVDVQSGVVRLRGTVAAPISRRVAEEIARKVADPIFVANGIEVAAVSDAPAAEPDAALVADEQDKALEGQLRSVLGIVPALSEVGVHVESGIVRFTGKTRDPAALARATELAGKLQGALFVDEQVEIVTTVPGQLNDTWLRLREKATHLVGRLPVFGVGLAVFFLAVFAARMLRGSAFVGRLFSSHLLLQTVALRVLSTVVIIGGAILALDLMDATAVVGALLGTAGIVGLAVGFAFKDIVENYLAGVLLAISRPFATKDAVKIGEFEGKVIRLSARETMLMTYDGNHVQIPNAQVFGNPVLNYTRNPRRRFDFIVGVGNEEDLARAQRVANQAMLDMDGVMDDPAPYTRLDGFGDSSMTLHFYGWVDQSAHDFQKVKSEVIRVVKRVLDENGIDLPNPITNVLLETVERKTEKPKAPESQAPAHDLKVDDEIESQIDEDPQAGRDLLES